MEDKGKKEKRKKNKKKKIHQEKTKALLPAGSDYPVDQGREGRPSERKSRCWGGNLGGHSVWVVTEHNQGLVKVPGCIIKMRCNGLMR